VKVVTDVPDKIIEYYNQYPDTGRKTLEREFGLSGLDARIYAYLCKNSHGIQTYQSEQPSENGKTVLVLPDIHFPYHDQQALDAAINYALKKYSLDTVIILGDGVDCYALSYFAKNPDHMPFNKEIEAARPLIEDLSRTFSGKELIWLEGNHEDRLRRELWGKSRIFHGLDALRVQNLYGITENGWNYISNVEALENDLPVLKIGNLVYLHGHEVPVSFNVVNIARVYYQRCSTNLMVGHLHQSSYWGQKKIDQELEAAWSLGCLCQLNPRWKPHNSWNNSFSVVVYDSTWDFQVDARMIQNGKVL